MTDKKIEEAYTMVIIDNILDLAVKLIVLVLFSAGVRTKFQQKIHLQRNIKKIIL